MGRQRYGNSSLSWNLTLHFLLFAVLLSFGCGGGPGGETPPGYIPPEISGGAGSGSGFEFTASGLSQDIDAQSWLQQTLFGASGKADPRLPNYSYFQGLLQAKEHIVVAGQVRVVGGMVGADEGVASLYAGAMVTTNPFSFTGADGLTGGPAGIRTRIGHWEEIPTP